MAIGERERRIFSAFDLRFFIRAGISILVLPLAAVAVSRLIYPFDTGNAEGLSWTPAGHLLAGENPYSFAFAPPYSMTPYGVVYYGFIAAGIKLFGLQLWWSRILSVLGYAVCLAAAAKITRRLTTNKEAVLVTVLAGLAMFPMQMWIALMRADLIAAAFASAALYLGFTLGEKDALSFRRAASIILFAALAFFTKHTYLMPACFIFLRFVQIGKRRAAFAIILSFALVVGAGILLLDYSSAGGYVWQHFIHARALPFDSGSLLTNFPASLKRAAFLFFLIFLPVFFYKNRAVFDDRRRAVFVNLLRSPRLLIFIYFAVSLFTAFVSAGRVGANVNYYIENSFVAIVICGLIYDDFRRRAVAENLALALVVLLTAGGAFQLFQIGRGEYIRWQSLDYYRAAFARAGEVIARANEPRPACVSIAPEMVVWHGCTLYHDDFEEYERDWSPELKAIFDREMLAGKYAAVVWYNADLQSRFPNYRLVEMPANPSRFHSIFIYERNR